MVRAPATAAVGSTGSSAAGRALFDAAASRPHPIPVFAEMSSLNPLFVLPGALAERAATVATGLVTSFTLGVGQFFTKPGLVFITRSPDTDTFLQKLADAVRATPCGTMLTSGIRDAFLENRTKVTTLAGVQLLASATAAASDTRTESAPSVATTTAQNFLAHPALAAEAFGPFTLVVIAEHASELAACAAALEGQLTATVHGNAADLAAAAPLLSTLEHLAAASSSTASPPASKSAPR